MDFLPRLLLNMDSFLFDLSDGNSLYLRVSLIMPSFQGSSLSIPSGVSLALTLERTSYSGCFADYLLGAL